MTSYTWVYKPPLGVVSMIQENKLRSRVMEEWTLEGLWKVYMESMVRHSREVPKFIVGGRVLHGEMRLRGMQRMKEVQNKEE